MANYQIYLDKAYLKEFRNCLMQGIDLGTAKQLATEAKASLMDKLLDDEFLFDQFGRI